jgi:NADPH-dependent curcumin reductase CurA
MSTVMENRTPAVRPPGAVNRQVRVAKRADGIPTPDVFAVTEEPAPACPTSGALIRILYSSVDPGMRGWVSAEKNYMTVPDGDVMRAHGVGKVIESDLAAYKVGDLVYGWFGWQQYCAASAADIAWPIDVGVAPPETWLGVLGLNGLTGWVGFQHFGRPKAGETILVSTAAGGVGGVVGQLAKAAGLRAVGLTSSAEKVALALTEFGYSDAIDYRAASDLAASIRTVCPDGIDIFYDNTAGWIADAVFPALNPRARVIQCGTASVASWIPTPEGPRRERSVLVNRLSWHGFIVMDHTDLFPQAFGDLKALYACGALVGHDDILPGLQHAPGAIARLYRGENRGRLIIKP